VVSLFPCSRCFSDQVQVISGDTGTSEIHLQACETLIRVKLAQSPNGLADITKGLHVIFAYLRSMQEATNLLCDQHEGNNRHKPRESVASSSSPAERDVEADLPSFLISEGVTELKWWTLELTYGLPTTLTSLLRKATILLRNDLHLDPSELQSRIDQLEDEILEYPIDVSVAWLGTAAVSQGNRLIMQHYSQAFHQALIIFYCYKARKMHRKHLQQYVQGVIYHLERVAQVQGLFGLHTGSMLWPAFVGGSQALETDIQTRFLRWLDLLDREGIWTSNLTKDALVEIWSRDKVSGGAASIHLVLT